MISMPSESCAQSSLQAQKKQTKVPRHDFSTIDIVPLQQYVINMVSLLHMKPIISPQRSSSFITVPPRTIIKSCQSTKHPSESELYFWLLYSLKQKREIYESCNNNIYILLAFGKSLGIIFNHGQKQKKNRSFNISSMNFK